MHHYPILLAKARRKALEIWLGEKFNYTHFVTLASNNPMMSVGQMTKLLRSWDARVNRTLYGPKWQDHKDELLWYFAFIEKPGVNPHWHLLLRTYGQHASPPEDLARLKAVMSRHWIKLVSSGTVDVQEIVPGTYKTVANYIAKETSGELQYHLFRTPDDFRGR